jgi:formylglycine-generating enzyme required for sulfatase activity
MKSHNLVVLLSLFIVLHYGCNQAPEEFSYEDPEQNQPDTDPQPNRNPVPDKLVGAEKPQYGKSFSHPTLPLEMIWVDPGHYWMGSKRDDAPESEKPNALVSISKGFWLAKYETTQELYQAITQENPSEFKFARQPVEYVAYYEAEDFCEKLTAVEKQSGRLPDNYSYHLPTESQWEFVAKGGSQASKVEFPPFEYYAWHKDNCKSPNIVGMKEPHPLGFYDILGNVSELCYGRYATLPSLPKKDWIGPQDGQFCVARGGNWFVEPSLCTTTARLDTLPTFQMAHIGFRIALSDILNR